MDAVLAHRAEQDLGRMTVHDPAADQMAVGRVDFLADRRIDPLPGVRGEVAVT
jgi:hypothetical protein